MIAQTTFNVILTNAISEGAKVAIKEAAKEYGKKVVLGIACEVAIHFGSKKIIEMIEEQQNKEEEVSAVEA